MADRIEQFAVTAPAGTARANPIEIQTRFSPGELEEIEIVVPDGHSGLTGIALALAHQVLVPATFGQYITSNDEIIHWPVSNLPNSGAWSAFVYNTDVFDHQWFVRYLVRELGSRIRLAEPTAPGDALVIGVGSGDLPASPDLSGDVVDIGGASDVPPDTTIPPDAADTTEPVDTGLPADITDTSAEPVDTTAPADVTGLPAEPLDSAPVVEAAPPPPPPPPPVVIATYPLPGGYSAGPVPLFGNPGNVGMLIGQVLGAAMIGQGNNANGAYNTWRFFSDLGNTMDWNFYTSGAKRLQWVGPFNPRYQVPYG